MGLQNQCGSPGSICSPNDSATNGKAATLAQAEAECAFIGQRLCDADELMARTCCTTGCGMDKLFIWSAIDQIVCAIRDCIDKADYGGFSLGYAVYDDGERVTDAGGGMCFDRRASDSRTTRAHIDVSRLVQALDARAAAQSAEAAYLRSSGLAWRPGSGCLRSRART